MPGTHNPFYLDRRTKLSCSCEKPMLYTVLSEETEDGEEIMGEVRCQKCGHIVGPPPEAVVEANPRARPSSSWKATA